MAVNAPTAPGAGRLPFLPFTRWIPEFLGNVPITLGGQRGVQQLDNAGYGDMLILHVKGTFTVATAPLVFLAGAPWNIISQLVVNLPGLASPENQSGIMRHLWNLVEKNFAPFVGGEDFPGQGLDVNAFDASIIDVFPLPVGAQTAHLWYVIPFHRSSMDPRGIVPLGNKNRANVTFAVAAAADLVTTPANLTIPSFSVDVYQAYLSAPAAGLGADPDPLWAVTYEELTQGIAALGQQPINIEPNDTIIGLIHYVIMNGVGDSTDIKDLTLRINKSYYHQAMPGDGWHFIQRRRLGYPLPPGVILYDADRFVDVDLRGGLDTREWIHSENVNAVQSSLNVATGTLGTNPRIITGVRRLVDLDPGNH